MAKLGERSETDERFWDIAEPYLAAGALVEGTMMGHQCLRTVATNGFVATVERDTGNLVVKLPKERVAALIESGAGLPFAPAQRVFSEWVALASFDERLWSDLIEEAMVFVDGGVA